MPVTRTYYVKNSGEVLRLDNFGTTPVDVSIAGVQGSLFDVETDPNDGDKVFVVGQGLVSNSNFGIYVSSDAGATWQIPGGNYQTNANIAGILTWYEVFVLDSNNIFVAGRNGYIAVSNDGGLTFNLSTQLAPVVPYTGGAPIVPLVKSIHFITPLIGIVGANAYVAITYDGGVTWLYVNGGSELIGPSGSSLEIVGVHLSADQQTIVAAGQGRIFTSTNAGSTFTETFDWSGYGLHLTWINDLELWGTGLGNLVVKTIDGGLNWTVVRAYTSGGPNRFAAHFYQGQNGYISNNGGLAATSDGGITLTSVDPGNQVFISAVWTWVAENTCYLLTSCDSSVAPFVVDNDLSAIVGDVVKVCPENIQVGINNPGGQPFSISESVPLTVYVLVDCCNPQNEVLLPNYNLAPIYASGSIIQIDQLPGICWTIQKPVGEVTPTILSGTITGYRYANCASCNNDFPCSVPNPPDITECVCFTVSEAPDCEGAITLQNFDTPQIFPTCDECISGQQPPCFLLEDCAGVLEPIITYTDLTLLLGQVIKISTCGDTCFEVSISQTCIGSIAVAVTANYPDCPTCLAVPQVPVELITRSVKPGYNTPGCSPEYTERITCKYGETMFDQMAVERYGITICCDHDVDRWDIEKRILDLKAIYDPAYEKPLAKTCYCYTITQVINTVTYSYISCEGNVTTVELTPGQETNVCSQIYPRPCCPPEGSEFTIDASETACTSNEDCVP